MKHSSAVFLSTVYQVGFSMMADCNNWMGTIRSLGCTFVAVPPAREATSVVPDGCRFCFCCGSRLKLRGSLLIGLGARDPSRARGAPDAGYRVAVVPLDRKRYKTRSRQ